MGLITFDPPYAASPKGVPRIDKTSPFASGLVFCAYPVGKTAIDLITGVYGTPTSAVVNALKPRNGGHVGALKESIAVQASDALDQISWPASSTLRGGSAIQQGTILCLGGITEQVSTRQYLFGSSMNVDGSGMGLRISTGVISGLSGTIVRSKSSSTAIAESAVLLGSTPGLATHLFGYTYNANGANGKWLGGRRYEYWTGGTAFGTGNTSRQAFLFTDYNNASYSHKTTYVSLFCIWDREISVGEYQALYDNPWQIFAPRRIFVPVTAAGSSLPTLGTPTHVPGSLTTTGFRPRVPYSF